MGEQIGNSSWIQCIDDTRKGQLRVPELRSVLTDFILVHHPEVPLVEGSTKQDQRFDHGVLYDFAYFDKPHYAWAMLSQPRLRVSLPINDGNTTEVKLASSAFPVDDSHVHNITFSFELPELDLRCRLQAKDETGFKSWVTSISTNSEPFTMHTPIGSQIRSWPKWTRAITGTDIDEISSILQRKDLTVVPENRKILRGYNRY